MVKRYNNARVVTNPVSSLVERKVHRGTYDYERSVGDAILMGHVYGSSLIPTAVLSTVESISDFVAGTALQVVGQKEAAKDLYSNSWSGKIKQKVRDYVNPAGNKTLNTIMDVGDVVADAAVLVGLTLATGGAAGAAAGAAGATGAAATASVKVASLMPIFLSAAGSGTAEAVQTTGKLGAKENIYGVTTGAVELATEYALGAGGKILRGAGFLGEAGEEATKGIARHAVLKGILTNAGGEFMEESMSYGASVALKNATGVDPNAKFDMSEMFKVGLMGSVAGGVLGFGSSAISVGNATSAGKRIVEKGEGAINETLAEASALVSEAAKTSEGTFTNMVAVDRVNKALSLYQEDEKSGKLTKSRQAYYLGQISQGLYEVEMYDSAAQYGKDIANTVAKGGEDAQRLIDGANAMFEENLGRKLTAEDFASVDSIGTKMLSAVSVYKNLTTPTDAELVDVNIRNESAVAYSPEKMATDIAALNEGEGTALYNLGNGKMAVVTKRAGDGSISVGLIENRDSTKVKAQHGIKSIEGAIEAVNAMQNGTFGQLKASAHKKAESILKEKFEITEKNVENANVKQFEKAPEAAKSPKKTEAAKKPEAPKKAEPKKVDKVEKAEVKTEKKEAPKKEAEDISKVEDRLRFKKYEGMTFTASEISAARADFKYFDALPASVRSDILVMRKSAAEAKIPDSTVKGLTRLMAAYHFKAVFSSEITSNGFWRHGKNLLVVNPNDIYQTTFGHELSHRVEDYKGYDAFASAVESLVGKARLDAEMKKYLADYNASAEANGWKKWDAEKNAEDLRREAVANIVGKYLSNSEYIDKLANADRGFVYRIYRSIKGMKRDIALANQISTEAETSKLTEYRTIRRMEKVFEISLGLTEKQGETLVGMERGDGISYNLASYKKKMIRIEDKDGNVTMKSGREILSDMLKKNPSMSERDIKDTLDQIDSVASELEKFGAAFDNFVKWSEASIEYNPDSGELVLTSLVKNGEYEMNIDFSTICKKRVAFTNVLNAIVRSGKDIHLTPTKIAHINTVLAEHGFETACKMCFVESKRNNLQAWAKNFVNGKGGKNAQKGWNALVKSVNPNATPFALVKEKTEVSDEDILELDHSLRSDIAANTEVLDAVIQARVDSEKKDNTESKIAKLLKEHPEYAHTLEKEDLFGSEGVTALKSKYPEVYSILLSSYGVATPKITLPAAPYASELAVASEVQKHNTKKQTVSDYTLSIGGVRVQSFSDYMVLRFFDYVQMIADGASQGMAMQSYTKEISYAYLFGKTGMKINLSIVPRVDAATVKKYGKDYAGLIAREDGTFDYAFAKESIQLEDKVVDGRLVKGAFSLINEEGYRGNVGTILIGVSRQHILKALADPRISMVIPYHKSGLNKTMASLYGIADFVDYTNVQNTRDAEGSKFKKDPFDFYASYRKHKGDSKKVADEYLSFCDENGYLPKFDEFRGDPNYYKLLIDFTSDYTDASGKRHVVQQGAVKLNLPDDWMDVVKVDLGVEQKTSSKLDAEMDSIIKEVLSTDITNAQAAQRQKKLDEDVSRSVSSTDRAYLDAVKRGDMDTAQRMVDEAALAWGAAKDKSGSPLRLYHGTSNFGFTEFDPTLSDDKMSFFLSSNRKVSETYSGGPGKTKISERSNISREALESADAKTMQTLLSENVDKKYELIDEEEHKKIVEGYRAELDYAIHVASHIGDAFDATDKSRALLEEYVSTFESMKKADTYTEFMDAYEQFEKTKWDLYRENERLFTAIDVVTAEEISAAYRGLTSSLGTSLYRISGEANFINQNEAIEMLNHALYRGVYELYANLGKQLVIDAKGANWAQIDGTTIDSDGLVNTRKVAQYAKENGYDSALIKNVIDTASYSYYGAGDVYILFDSNRLKSADPVTYDDDGNVIPLSERFNAEDDDIRRSVSSQPTMIKFNAPSGNLGIMDRLKRIGGNVKSAITEADSRKAALEVMREAFDTFSVHWSNSFAAVETQLRRMVSNGTWDGSYGRITRQSAQEKVQSVRLSEAKALGMLTVGQYKVDGTKYENGEPLFKILEPVLAKKGETITVEDDDGNLVTMKANGSELAGALYQEFCDYAAHVTALERSAIGKDPWSHLSDADKQGKIAEYERKHPEFKDILEKFAQFNRNVLQYRVDAGTLSQESMDAMIAQYPHYIPMIKPTIEQMNTTGAVKGKSSIAVTNNIKKAKGGDHIVNDPIAAYCDQVIGAIKAANTNILMQELYDTADGKHVISDKMLENLGEEMETVSKDFISNPDENADAMSILESMQKKATDGATNAVYFYKNGKIHSMKVSKDIFLGLQSINKSDYTFRGGWMIKGMAALNSGYKRLVTSMNPFFSPKNMIRDLWDGLMHSRFSVKKFTVEYAKLGSMMAGGKITEHPMWDEFISNGGLQASYFDRSEGKLHRRSKRTGLEASDAGAVGKTMQTIENVNVLIEALPRFTEYVLTRNNGGSVAEALNNSAEVTTNFARAGVWGGFLNKTIMPFLNPSIQGFSKPIRNIIEHGSYKGMISLLGRAALLGVVPIILNNLLYNDDEDYEVLDDSTKENNFVFKVGDYFVKIPRGRVVSVVSGLYNRTTKQMTGRYVDWKDYLENVKSQATPLDSITRTIFSPFKDVATNTTWYGGVIENESMQNLAPEDRYDEYTSSLAIAIGKVTGKTIDVSPKKIHYLLDQYSGIIGDLVLPITSTASKSNPLVSNFAVDVNSNTNLSDRFYKIYNESLYQKNRGDEKAYYLNKRLGETKQQVSDLYKQIKEINQSDLSKAEKRSQVSILRATINQLYKTAIADASTYSKAVEAASVVESYYKVVKVTSGNAKKLGAEKESVGKYAVVYNDQTVRFCDTESEANEYKSSVARKTTYAEANRLAYGAQYALTQYNTALGEKASTLNRLGIDSERFYDFYMTSRYYSGSDKKTKIEKYCKEAGLSKNETAILMYFSGYTSYRDKVVTIAKKSGFTKAEIEAL